MDYITLFALIFSLALVVTAIIDYLFEIKLYNNYCPHCNHYTTNIPVVPGRIMECDNCKKHSLSVWRTNEYGEIKLVWKKLNR